MGEIRIMTRQQIIIFQCLVETQRRKKEKATASVFPLCLEKKNGQTCSDRIWKIKNRQQNKFVLDVRTNFSKKVETEQRLTEAGSLSWKQKKQDTAQQMSILWITVAKELRVVLTLYVSIGTS